MSNQFNLLLILIRLIKNKFMRLKIIVIYNLQVTKMKSLNKKNIQKDSKKYKCMYSLCK